MNGDSTTPPEGGWDRVIWSDARNPADHPLPTEAFNCPTGTCDNTPCSDIPRNVSRVIDPFSRAHVERNACNRCPTQPPIRTVIPSNSMFIPDTVVYLDSEGNKWGIDSAVAAPRFHGDGGMIGREDGSSTYRVTKTANGQSGGWQCRYYQGNLDDTSYDLGTYDYADAEIMAVIGSKVPFAGIENIHDTMDVQPHYANPRYTPGLTKKY